MPLVLASFNRVSLFPPSSPLLSPGEVLDSACDTGHHFPCAASRRVSVTWRGAVTVPAVQGCQSASLPGCPARACPAVLLLGTTARTTVMRQHARLHDHVLDTQARSALPTRSRNLPGLQTDVNKRETHPWALSDASLDHGFESFCGRLGASILIGPDSQRLLTHATLKPVPMLVPVLALDDMLAYE